MKRLFLKASFDPKTGDVVEMLYRGDFLSLPIEQQLYVLAQVGDSIVDVYMALLAQATKPARKPRAARKVSRAIH